jgi:hypothetical protein
MTVSTSVLRSDTGAPARAGAVTCRVNVDGKRVPALGAYVGGRASCAFVVPKSGRRVSGMIAVRADGIATAVPFAIRLR